MTHQKQNQDINLSLSECTASRPQCPPTPGDPLLCLNKVPPTSPPAQVPRSLLTVHPNLAYPSTTIALEAPTFPVLTKQTLQGKQVRSLCLRFSWLL